MSTGTRLKVLTMFKKLNRVKDQVFVGDSQALQAARNKIKDEFSKHKSISSPQKIEELLKIAQESEEMLRTKVVQLSKVREHVYSFRTEHLQQKCNVRETCANCTCGR